MFTVQRWEREQAAARSEELCTLLEEAVRAGASVGFLAALSREEAHAYWRKIADELPGGARCLFVALAPDGGLVGAAQLAVEVRANGRHRAEVQKVLVHATRRRCGVGRALRAAVEAEAARRRLRLLFLDTSTGASGAGDFYRQLGYSYAGGIPEYAADPDGRLVANAIFYKLLATTPRGT